MDEIYKLIKDRDSSHGDSWLLTGQLIYEVTGQFEHFMRTAPMFLVPWMMILNKLMRLLFTPYNKDTWTDIAGYAQLVLRHMEEDSAKDDLTVGGVFVNANKDIGAP